MNNQPEESRHVALPLSGASSAPPRSASLPSRWRRSSDQRRRRQPSTRAAPAARHRDQPRPTLGGDPVPGLLVDCFGLTYIPQLAIRAQPLNTTYGTPGDDVIFGTSGNDVIIALEGDDRVCAGDGDDEVYGDEWFAWYDTDGDPGGG